MKSNTESKVNCSEMKQDSKKTKKQKRSFSSHKSVLMLKEQNNSYTLNMNITKKETEL